MRILLLFFLIHTSIFSNKDDLILKLSSKIAVKNMVIKGVDNLNNLYSIKNNELIVVTLSNGMTRSKLGCKESNYSCSEEILIPNGLAIEVGEDDYMLEECLSNIWEIEGYKNGIPNGKYKEWGLNNKGTYYLSCKGRYNEGIKYGTWEYYDKDGKVTHKKSH